MERFLYKIKKEDYQTADQNENKQECQDFTDPIMPEKPALDKSERVQIKMARQPDSGNQRNERTDHPDKAVKKPVKKESGKNDDQYDIHKIQ